MEYCCCCLLAKSCLTLCDPMDCNPPGSSVHGIPQARILEWGAISPQGIFPTQGSNFPRWRGPAISRWRPNNLACNICLPCWPPGCPE